MRRLRMLAICLLAVASFMATTAWAQNGHYIKLSPSIDTNTACYDVALKEAGLGNSGIASVSYELSATVSYTDVCVNKGGNDVQGQPKSGTTQASSITTLTVRNGQTNGIVSLCPTIQTLPDPGCTGNQALEIIAASYSGVKLDDQLPADVTAGVLSLTSLSASGLRVIVK